MNNQNEKSYKQKIVEQQLKYLQEQINLKNDAMNIVTTEIIKVDMDLNQGENNLIELDMNNKNE